MMEVTPERAALNKKQKIAIQIYSAAPVASPPGPFGPTMFWDKT